MGSHQGGRPCPTRARQRDQHRNPNTDRYHVHLYASLRWRRLRREILTARPWCECPDCGGTVYFPPASVVHHKEAHHGDETLFFDPMNLQPLAKSCHDRITKATTESKRV